MAETADNVAQRYAVLEQAYTKEDWATVLRDGEALLGQLRQANTPGLLGLQMRLQLLLGHTHLYGFADKEAAARFYGTVASKSSEAALAKIAEQGLEQCSGTKAAATGPEPEPRAEPEPQAEAEATPEAAETTFTTPTPVTFEAAATAPPGSAATTPAAPWLTSATPANTTTETPSGPSPATGPVGVDIAGAPTPAAPWVTESPTPAPEVLSPELESLIPEVVEEPELIELHQADPRLAEEVELTWKEPAPTSATAQGSLPSEPLPEEDEELLSGLMLVRLG
jgi:hypothetical protein